jgi:hypothetical protein
MKDGIFMYFIRELKLFVKLKAIMFVKIPLRSKKAGVNNIANRFNVGIFNMCKYVDIIVVIVISRDKLFSHFIFMFHDL